MYRMLAIFVLIGTVLCLSLFVIMTLNPLRHSSPRTLVQNGIKESNEEKKELNIDRINLKQQAVEEKGNNHITQKDMGEAMSATSSAIGTSTEKVVTEVKKVSTSTQYVLLSFDGSRSPAMWKETMQFAKEMKEQGKTLHFTYFVSGVYFVPVSSKRVYHPPQHATGTSYIGWADSVQDVADRIALMNQAIADGHEIGSHANGHFDGSKWSKEEWLSELKQFTQFVMHPEKQVPELSEQNPMHQRLVMSEIKGFRAPELGRNAALYQAMAEEGYRYDASGVGKDDAMPVKDGYGIWHLPLAKIQRGTTTRAVLSMDFNFYTAQSNAKDTARRGTPEWQYMHDEMLMSYQNYFKQNKEGSRAPVIIGHHFSKWNDGVYWQVMQDFAKDVCGQPEVKCLSMQEYVDVLDALPHS